RKADITTFINNGGGLFASSECGIRFVSCDATNVSNNASLFAYLPVTASSRDVNPPFSITAFGASIGAPFGFTSGDLQDPTHNSFAPIVGLNAVDLDASGHPTTLAGVVHIGDDGFTPTVPEPSTLVLLGSGLLGVLRLARRKSPADYKR